LVFSEQELENFDLKHLQGVYDKEKSKKIDQPNLGVLSEYRKKMEVYSERSKSVEEASKLRDVKKHEYEELRRTRLETFMTGFTQISLKLKEMYQVLFVFKKR
jgi:structural maintenance of chromosome 4